MEEGEDEVKQGAILGTARPGDFLFLKGAMVSISGPGKKRFTRLIAFFPLTITVFVSLFGVSFAEIPKRIISLAPNVTEILFALGAEDRVIAVSSFCDYPEGTKLKPTVGGMSNPSLEAVVSINPDIVLFSIDGNPKTFEERLRSMNVRTFTLRSRRITELPAGIRQVGAAVGAPDKAEALARETEKKISALEERERTIRKPQSAAQRQKVLFIIWPEPLIVAGPGSIADDALQMIGVLNISGNTVSSYPKYSIEEIIRQAPDTIFIGKGTGMDKVADGLLKRLKSVPAVRNRRVFYVSDYLYRLGPRTMQGVEELERLLR